MATLREYFDNDFNYAARVFVRLSADPDIEAAILYDFSSFIAFFACYVRGADHALDFFLGLVEALQPGKSQASLNEKVVLPSTRHFPGVLQVRNVHPFEMLAQFHGDPDWTSSKEITASTRLFVYSETQLGGPELAQLKRRAADMGLRLQFRSMDHAEARSKYETPLAFISHDSRDKLDVARKIATKLQGLMCPVWYDEFSLTVGANLRDSIEGGLKKCKKCVLVLSPNFFSNCGWTKREFDSIFTREILEQRQLVLPVWYGVTKEAVYQYSPSLLNVKGLDWDQLGEDEVCRQLCQAILNHEM
jgi:hypothetical protein